MVVQDNTSLVAVTKQGVAEMKTQRKLLADYVRSQLKEADFSKEAEGKAYFGEGDYGIIPGTKKQCLLKAGAEKLLRLFNLGVRTRLVTEKFDLQGNFASYTYRSEVYLLKNGVAVAECEGTVNSQEKKYANRTAWKKNEKGVSESTQEPTPIADISNTMMKMAQKRAMVGAVIIATGATEFFTQDILDMDEHFDMPKGTKDVTPKQSPVEQAKAASSEAPECCGKKMMVSKYVDKDMGHAPYYCMECKNKVARTEGAA